MLWIKKHAPKDLKEIPYEIELILETIKNKKHIIIHGQTGTSKTTIAHTIAKNGDYEILELNASNTRNKEQINSLLGTASQQMSLFMKKKLILLDEIDSLSGTKDRGGIQAINKILDKTKFPIIMTCNDINNDKLKTVKKKCTLVETKPLTTQKLFLILKNICTKENITYEDSQLKTLARASDGDIRGAIIDLQTLSIINNKLNLDHYQDRSPKQSIQNALQLIFKSKSFKLTSESLWATDIDLDTAMLWIEYNLPKEYTKKEDIYNAYEKLSKADIFRRRIRTRQYWRYMVYQNILSTAGVALSKKEKYTTPTIYKRSTRLLQIWRANMKNAKKKAIAKKFAESTHMSHKEAIKQFHYYKHFLTNKDIINELQLSEDEIVWLKK